METTKSEQNPKQIAEQAWIEQSTKRWHELESDPTKFDDPFIQGISDYKQALREAVERHMGKVSGDVENAYVNGRTLALKKVLQLIETVTPKE